MGHGDDVGVRIEHNKILGQKRALVLFLGQDPETEQREREASTLCCALQPQAARAKVARSTSPPGLWTQYYRKKEHFAK